MSNIHYFQRYSTLENTVTNNTLHLIGRIYEYSPDVAGQFLTNLTGASVKLGIEINQQGREGDAVPDGTIIQRSLKISIEAKVGAPVDKNQLIRHAKTFSFEAQENSGVEKILLLLTTQRDDEEEKSIRAELLESSPAVTFKWATFEDICKIASQLFMEHETAMHSLVEDYKGYCIDTKLFDHSEFLMLVVPCPDSEELNSKYGIYFQPSLRSYRKHAYVGLYRDKSVRTIIKVESVFDVEIINEKLKKTLVKGNDTSNYDDKILEIAKAAKTECGWDISTGHRFLCGEYAPTDFKKSTKGGIRGPIYIDLRDHLDVINIKSQSLEELAKSLSMSEKSWE